MERAKSELQKLMFFLSMRYATFQRRYLQVLKRNSDLPNRKPANIAQIDGNSCHYVLCLWQKFSDKKQVVAGFWRMRPEALLLRPFLSGKAREELGG